MARKILRQCDGCQRDSDEVVLEVVKVARQADRLAAVELCADCQATKTLNQVIELATRPRKRPAGSTPTAPVTMAEVRAARRPSAGRGGSGGGRTPGRRSRAS